MKALSKKNIINYDWSKINRHTRILYKKIIEKGFIPDCIIGIARGGLVPAVTLSYIFKCRFFGYLQFQRTLDDEPYSLVDDTNILLGMSLPDKNIKNALIVDDILVHGVIFEDTVGILKNKYGTINILGAFLYKEDDTYVDKIKQPYVFSKKIKTGQWIVYPWES